MTEYIRALLWDHVGSRLVLNQQSRSTSERPELRLASDTSNFRSPHRKLFYQSRQIHFSSSVLLEIGFLCTISARVNRIRLHSSGGRRNSTELIVRLQEIEFSASLATGVVFGAEGTKIVIF